MALHQTALPAAADRCGPSGSSIPADGEVTGYIGSTTVTFAEAIRSND